MSVTEHSQQQPSSLADEFRVPMARFWRQVLINMTLLVFALHHTHIYGQHHASWYVIVWKLTSTKGQSIKHQTDRYINTKDTRRQTCTLRDTLNSMPSGKDLGRQHQIPSVSSSSGMPMRSTCAGYACHNCLAPGDLDQRIMHV
jgi:hypothetical protein